MTTHDRLLWLKLFGAKADFMRVEHNSVNSEDFCLFIT